MLTHPARGQATLTPSINSSPPNAPVDFMSEANRLDKLAELPWRSQTGIGRPGDVSSDRWLEPVAARPDEPDAGPATAAQVYCASFD